MPNRQIVNGEPYRYGYQGEYAETDPETGKPAFQLRLYDPRINRWLTVDPAGQYHSPYMSMGNSWPNRVDPDGGCDQPDSSCGWFKRLFYSSTQIGAWDAWQSMGTIGSQEMLNNVTISAVSKATLEKRANGPFGGLMIGGFSAVPSGARVGDLPDVYIEANAGLTFGKYGGEVSFLGTKVGLEAEFAKSSIENIGFKMDTSDRLNPFQNNTGLNPYFSGDSFGGASGYYGVGGEVMFDLKSGNIKEVKVAAGVVEYITEFHTNGPHAGKVARSRVGFEFGGGLHMIWGAEAKINMGFIIPPPE